MTQNKSRFPVTLWPATPLSPVVVERWALVHDGGQIDWRARLEPRELPPEWPLRQLADVDLDDDAALAHLLETYGAITWPYCNPMAVPPERLHLLGHLPSPDEHDDWWVGRSDGTLEDARWWLRTVRVLARVWAGADPPTAWAAEGFVVPPDARTCWTLFALALNEGLRPFRAHVEYHADYEDGFEFIFGLPQVGLYSAACRQVFNLLVQGESARRCENETCGHTFVHQLGGAQHGQYRRKGPLRYCTPECARAQTQREYRRRKTALKETKQ